MTIFEEFESNHDSEYDKWMTETEIKRKQFIKDYPIEKIMQMTIMDYLTGLEINGKQKDTFCHRIRYDLQGLCSMGDARPSVFGIYFCMKNQKTVTEKPFSDVRTVNPGKAETELAFNKVKQQIYYLLVSVKNGNLSAIKESRLNKLFRNKLLMIYFPEHFIPVVTNDALGEYCAHVGISVNQKEDPIVSNLALLEWKKSHQECADWPNSKFMFFCVWLCKTGKFYKEDLIVN